MSAHVLRRVDDARENSRPQSLSMSAPRPGSRWVLNAASISIQSASLRWRCAAGRITPSSRPRWYPTGTSHRPAPQRPATAWQGPRPADRRKPPASRPGGPGRSPTADRDGAAVAARRPARRRPSRCALAQPLEKLLFLGVVQRQPEGLEVAHDGTHQPRLGSTGRRCVPLRAHASMRAAPRPASGVRRG